MITVYSRPGCSACDATKRYLDRHQLPYRAVDVSVDPVAHNFVLGLGYSSLPVVTDGDSHWCGMRPDRLLGLADA